MNLNTIETAEALKNISFVTDPTIVCNYAATMLRQQQAEIQTQYGRGFDDGCKHTKKIYEAEIEALKKQQASIHNPLFINQQQGEVKQGFYEVLRKAKEK